MVAHAYDGYPFEACGLLGGSLADATIVAFAPCRNVDESARTYSIGPDGWRDAEAAFDALGVEVVGVVHSHTHTDAVPVADRHRQGRQPAARGLALPHRLAARHRSRAAVLPARRPHGRRGSRGAGRAGRIPSVPLRFQTRSECGGRLLLGPRHDRQHADDRRQPAQPEPATSASSPRWRARTRAGRSRTASPVDDRRGRARRHAARPGRRSSSRRRATPASRWR